MYPVKKRSPDSPKPSRRRQAINCLNSLLAVTFKRVIISLSLLFIHNPRGIRSGWPRCIFKHAGKIELIFEADIAPNGGDRHPRGAEQQFGLADALILPPAEDADPQLLAEQVRQTRGRQADVLGDAGDIKMAVRQMVADVLAGVAHPVVQRRMQRFVDRLHPPQQQLFQQVYRQQFGIAPRPLPGINDLAEQLAKTRLPLFIRTKKPVWAKIVGQLSHSCQ